MLVETVQADLHWIVKWIELLQNDMCIYYIYKKEEIAVVGN
jgi:hypothetical protein